MLIGDPASRLMRSGCGCFSVAALGAGTFKKIPAPDSGDIRTAAFLSPVPFVAAPRPGQRGKNGNEYSIIGSAPEGVKQFNRLILCFFWHTFGVLDPGWNPYPGPGKIRAESGSAGTCSENTETCCLRESRLRCGNFFTGRKNGKGLRQQQASGPAGWCRSCPRPGRARRVTNPGNPPSRR